MGPRAELHSKLCSILGSNNIYFQPPESIKLQYPCIVYELSNIESTKADDIKFTLRKKYSVTFISLDPDSNIPEKLLQLRYCAYDRRFVNDNMYHDVFTIYF